MQLSVIIVNYNVKHFLEQCLYSVQKACQGIAAEIFVVDNCSTDGSRALLEPRFPGVQFTWNTANTGFAAANNQAVAKAKGDYILFLNPDTILPEDCIQKCIAFFLKTPQAGAVGVRMIDGSGKFLKESKRAFPSPATSLYKLSGLAQLFPRSKTFARYHLGHLSQHCNHEVDVLAGAYMMIPKPVLDKTGSFDETFFMYGEDVDLSYRIQQAGYRNYYLAESTIIHFKGESTKKGSLNYVRLFYKAMSQFVRKHYSGSKASLFILLVQLAIAGRAVLAILVKLLERAGLFLLDAGLIFMSFLLSKYYWSHVIRNDVNYSPNVLIIAFPAFTLLFLVAAYYAGLYDKGYHQRQLVRSAGIAALVLLSSYALLPEHLRFSRGILVLGIVLSVLLMNFMRIIFIRAKLLETTEGYDEKRQTIIVASQHDFEVAKGLMKGADMQERVLGRVHNNNDRDAEQALGSIDQLPYLINHYPVKEVVFCEDGLSFKEIIDVVEELPEGIRNKFHASGSTSIVGSDSKDVAGDYVSATKKYALAKPINRRNKNLFDVLLALIFLVLFPVLLFTQKKPGRFFLNLLSVLFRKKTWVGYAVTPSHLPPVKDAILTSTSLPARLNELPRESLLITDEWYAANYSVYIDLQKVWRGYRYLSY